jgi:hypothetical protein
MTLPLDPDRDGWFKSARSRDGEDCVEVLLGTDVGVRDTKDRRGGQLAISASGWTAFIDAVKTDR